MEPGPYAQRLSPAPTEAPAPEATPEPTEEPEPTPDPDIGLINLYIPAEYVGDMTEEDFQEFIEAEGIQEYYPQDDGGVVYVMTEETHRRLLSEISGEIDEAIHQLEESEEASAIRSITHNEDFSNFVFHVDRSAEDGAESFYALTFTMYGVYYQVYRGAFEPDCVVELEDAVTGEVYDTVSYQDWLDFLESFSNWGDDWGEDWGDIESSIRTPEMDSCVLLDQAGITVTATGFSSDFFGVSIDVHIVNNSDRTVNVGCDRLIINGYSADGYLYTTVDAGAEADDTLSLFDASLTYLETEYIGVIELQLIVTDEEYETICTGDVVELRTSDYDEDWEKVPEVEPIFSEGGLTIGLIFASRDEDWGSTDFTFLLTNDSDRILSVDFSGMKVNGADAFPWFYKTVYPGTRAIAILSVGDDSLEGTGSDTLDSLEIAITAYDRETYEAVIETPDFLPVPLAMG